MFGNTIAIEVEVHSTYGVREVKSIACYVNQDRRWTAWVVTNYVPSLIIASNAGTRIGLPAPRPRRCNRCQKTSLFERRHHHKTRKSDKDREDGWSKAVDSKLPDRHMFVTKLLRKLRDLERRASKGRGRFV